VRVWFSKPYNWFSGALEACIPNSVVITRGAPTSINPAVLPATLSDREVSSLPAA
jgi:hypothetical protein